MWQNAKTQWLVLSSPWKEGLPALGTPNLSSIHIFHAEQRPWGHLLDLLSWSAWHPNWGCASTSCVHLSPVEAGPSCSWHSAPPLCCPGSFTDVWEVSARFGLLRSKAIKMLNLLPLVTKGLRFQGPVTISYVHKVTILKMWRNRRWGFFPLLIPLYLSFASIKWEQYTVAHKSENVWCVPHESCKRCVMSHILGKRTRKQAMLLSELSFTRGGREKVEWYFFSKWRYIRKALNNCSFWKWFPPFSLNKQGILKKDSTSENIKI